VGKAAGAGKGLGVMLAEERVLHLLRKTGALLDGHFRLTSGRHSDRYIQCARLLQYPQYAAELGAALGERFARDEVQTVVGPAMGGILVSYEVARNLGVRSLFTERENGRMTLRRGFALAEGERVLVVEDVITTGGSVEEVLAVVREHGAVPVGVGALADRSSGKVCWMVRLEALIRLNVTSYPPEECPLCRDGIPVVKPGSRS